MSDKNKVVNINSYRKQNKKNKKNKNQDKNKLFLILFVGAVLALFIWNNFISGDSYDDLQISESDNISYDLSQIQSANPNEIIDQISQNNAQNKPVLLYLYTSWCSVCKRQLPIINEIARKYQNTDLEVISVVIDRDIAKQNAASILQGLDEIYFKPQYLVNRGNFRDLLREKSINFGKRIPFTAIIGRDSEIISQFSGGKDLKFIEKKVRKSLFKQNDN